MFLIYYFYHEDQNIIKKIPDQFLNKDAEWYILVKLLFSENRNNPVLKRLLSTTVDFNTLAEYCVFLIYYYYHEDQDIIKKIPGQFLKENGEWYCDPFRQEHERAQSLGLLDSDYDDGDSD